LLIFDESEGNAPVFTELVVYKIKSDQTDCLIHQFMVDGVIIFNFRMDITVENTSINNIRTAVYYDPNNPTNSIPSIPIKTWPSPGIHETSENQKYSYLNVEITYFIPEFKDYTEAVNDKDQDFSTLYARVRIVNTFKQKSSRT
jgi:hypothetical protein